MPKRILDLGEAGINVRVAKLCLSQDMQVPSYACLSYCWGKEEHNYCRLLRSNIMRFMKAIFLQDLPRTIRDAIWIARSLEIRYIWIDALCIIQDDSNDWQDQAPCMGDIYHNAILTIAASSSDHADRGLLQSRPAECYDLQPCELFKRWLGRPIPNLYRYLDDAPILRRAWTMQELYLSRRILYITDAFLAWECRYIHGTEFWPSGFPQQNDSSKSTGSTFPFFEAKEIFRSQTATPQAIHDAWQNLVSDYSSRKMTRQDDILVAVAGLASICKAVSGDDYLAGLWRKNLLNDLLWRSDESRCRSQNYTAPTWSWASTHTKHNPGHPDHRHTSIGFTKPRDATEIIFIVHDAQVSYVNSNDKLQATAGSLKISGKFAEASIGPDYNWAVHGGECLIIGVAEWEATGDLTFDTEDMVKTDYAFFGPHRARTTDTQLYCLAMTREDEEVDHESDWVTTDCDSEYERKFRQVVKGGGFSTETKKMQRSGRRWSQSDAMDPYTEPLNQDDVWNFEDGIHPWWRTNYIPSNSFFPDALNIAVEDPALGSSFAQEDYDAPEPAIEEGGGENEAPHQPSLAHVQIQNDLNLPLGPDGEETFTQRLDSTILQMPEDSLLKPDDEQDHYPLECIDSFPYVGSLEGVGLARVKSLDRENFHKWTKHYTMTRLSSPDPEERTAARLSMRKTWITAMILERVDDSSELYRRVGIAHFTIYGGKTEGFDATESRTVVII
jgi:hypothetical protein